jgi:hypothetical protein
MEKVGVAEDPWIIWVVLVVSQDPNIPNQRNPVQKVGVAKDPWIIWEVVVVVVVV